MSFRPFAISLLIWCFGTVIIMIIMEICKAPTLRLKALNKDSITHIMYIEMEMLSAIKMYVRKRTEKANDINNQNERFLSRGQP